MTDIDGEYVDCFHCGGTGHDDREWDGVCIFCTNGQVFREYPREDDDED